MSSVSGKKDRIFGDEPTDLILTSLAEEMYKSCYSCTIVEHGDSTYTISGAINQHNITLTEINELLEALAYEEAENSIRNLLFNASDEDLHSITINEAKKVLLNPTVGKKYPILSALGEEYFMNTWNNAINWIKTGI